MQIRRACLQDLKQLLDIYNYEVEHGVATFDLNPKTIEERTQWFHAHTGSHVLLVAQLDEGQVVGYASLSPYREKEAYSSTAELSVYVDINHRGKGIGRTLMDQTLKLATQDPALHTIVSVITGGNQASITLHRDLGFVHCGTIREVGEKFGRYLDIDHFQFML